MIFSNSNLLSICGINSIHIKPYIYLNVKEISHHYNSKFMNDKDPIIKKMEPLYSSLKQHWPSNISLDKIKWFDNMNNFDKIIRKTKKGIVGILYGFEDKVLAGHARPVMDGREIEVNGVYDDVVMNAYKRIFGFDISIILKDLFALDKINY